MYISPISQKIKSESIDRVMFVQSNCIQLHHNLNELKTPNPNQNNQYTTLYTDHVRTQQSQRTEEYYVGRESYQKPKSFEFRNLRCYIYIRAAFWRGDTSKINSLHCNFSNGISINRLIR